MWTCSYQGEAEDCFTARERSEEKAGEVSTALPGSQRIYVSSQLRADSNLDTVSSWESLQANSILLALVCTGGD